MTGFRTVGIAALALMIPIAANADIGAIGSPVTASNVPKASKNSSTQSNQAVAAPAKQPEKTPLLVIRFDRKHVYFDRELRQALAATETSHAGTVYQVISYVPSAGTPSANERRNDDSNGNLNAVVSAMREQGIPESRISLITETRSSDQPQEIDIFTQ